MSREEPPGERRDLNQKDKLRRLIDVIEKYWEGKDYAFIERVRKDLLNFMLTIDIYDKEKTEEAAQAIQELGYDVRVRPNTFNPNLAGKVEFSGVFLPEEIDEYTERLGVLDNIKKYN